MNRLLTVIVLLLVFGTWLVIGLDAQDEHLVQDGQTLRFASSGDVDTLDPHAASWAPDFRIIECMFEPMLRVTTDTGELELAAAEDWHVSEDGLTYTFHLRRNARWSNGDPVLSSDFVYGWRRAMLPDLAGYYSSLFFHIEGAEAFFHWRAERLSEYAQRRDRSPAAAEALWQQTLERFERTVAIDTPDDHTIVLRLRQPTSYFPEIVAFPTYSPAHQASVSRIHRLDPDSGRMTREQGYFSDPRRVITNGPYVLAQLLFKESLTLEQNPHYWNRHNMGNTRIVQYVIGSEMTALLRYQIGQIDWLPDIPTASPIAADLKRLQRDDVVIGPSAGTYYYLFNCRPMLANGEENPLADWRVRRALALCIDRQMIVDSITRMNQPPAVTFTPVGAIDGYDPPVEAGAAFDPEAARQLLAEAGYPGGRGLTGLSIMFNTEGGHELIAQTLARLWRDELGIVFRLEGVERNRYSDRRNAGDFTVARAGWLGDYRDPTTFLDMFRTGDGNNSGEYSSDEYDELMRQATYEMDRQRRFAILRQAETLMLREAAIAPIYQYTNLDIFNAEKVHELYPNVWNNRELHRVRLSP